MTTFGQIRRDPQKGKNGFSKLKGFTLIELMVVIAVGAIITMFALPSYRMLIEKRQVTSGAEQIGAFLSSAQMESVKHSQFVAVKYQPTVTGWCMGMRADDNVSVTCDCSPETDVNDPLACVVDGAFRIFNSSSLNYPEVLRSANVGGNDKTIVYDSVRGLIQNSETVKLELVSDGDNYALDVEVSVTGRVKICSNKSANKDVPGYKECSV